MNKKGFTLGELVIVMIIVGIMGIILNSIVSFEEKNNPKKLQQQEETIPLSEFERLYGGQIK